MLLDRKWSSRFEKGWSRLAGKVIQTQNSHRNNVLPESPLDTAGSISDGESGAVFHIARGLFLMECVLVDAEAEGNLGSEGNPQTGLVNDPEIRRAGVHHGEE